MSTFAAFDDEVNLFIWCLSDTFSFPRIPLFRCYITRTRSKTTRALHASKRVGHGGSRGRGMLASALRNATQVHVSCIPHKAVLGQCVVRKWHEWGAIQHAHIVWWDKQNLGVRFELLPHMCAGLGVFGCTCASLQHQKLLVSAILHLCSGICTRYT